MRTELGKGLRNLFFNKPKIQDAVRTDALIEKGLRRDYRRDITAARRARNRLVMGQDALQAARTIQPQERCCARRGKPADRELIAAVPTFNNFLSEEQYAKILKEAGKESPSKQDIRDTERQTQVGESGPRREAAGAPSEAIVRAAEQIEKQYLAFHIPKASGLNESERRIAERFGEWLSLNSDEARAQYEALNIPRVAKSLGGRMLSTDIARELSEDYRKDRSLSGAVNEPASWFIKQLYEQRVKEAPPGETVIFTAGGTGAGKTTSLSHPDLRPLINSALLVYDTNMRSLSSAIDKIEKALAAGNDVAIVYVHRDVVDALVHGVFPARHADKAYGSAGGAHQDTC